ncbi:hypothetical protein RHMOL_Rhmol11G0009400 [Rhododendron molle]|uniref:Uncharacterized protein n=1 Tax=Rhododendron molle TaxID=49168 RepID=A0ACC0LMD9_RHOML|nr:hypothetical protein RHMOL_Rhmol11G0009400 [Rhododendron molle]
MDQTIDRTFQNLENRRSSGREQDVAIEELMLRPRNGPGGWLIDLSGRFSSKRLHG